MFELKLDDLVREFGSYQTTSNPDWKYRFCCPSCGDKRYRLYINITKNVYKCFNENCAIRLPFNKTKSAPKLVELSKFLYSYDKKEVPVEIKEIFYPDYIISPTTELSKDYKDYWNYLEKREITQKDVIEYKLMFGRIGSVFENRIIFPVYFKTKLVYYQGRAIYSNTETRYLGAKEEDTNKKSLFLVNYDTAKNYKEVIVVEGVINMIKAGSNAIACLGKSISTYQYELLKNTWDNFSIALDSDANENSELLAKKLIKAGKTVRVVNFPIGKDISDIGKLEFLRLLNTAEYGVFGMLNFKLKGITEERRHRHYAKA